MSASALKAHVQDARRRQRFFGVPSVSQRAFEKKA
jgi:hypothetical protein